MTQARIAFLFELAQGPPRRPCDASPCAHGDLHSSSKFSRHSRWDSGLPRPLGAGRPEACTPAVLPRVVTVQTRTLLPTAPCLCSSVSFPGFRFAPGLSCVTYAGDKEERAHLQRDLRQEPHFHVLLTTYEVSICFSTAKTHA